MRTQAAVDPPHSGAILMRAGLHHRPGDRPPVRSDRAVAEGQNPPDAGSPNPAFLFLNTNGAEIPIMATGQAKQATIYRMVTPEHTCPYGLKSIDLLRRKGYAVNDNLLKCGSLDHRG